MLEQVVIGLVTALLAWLERRSSTPATMQDAATPDAVRAAWDRYLAARLRDKNRDAGQSK